MRLKFPIDFDKEKSLRLKETRGVSFEEVVEFLEREDVLDDIPHPNKGKYPNQKMLILVINEYVYAIPYVIDKERQKTFLKTIYPNRILTKKYLKGKKV